MAIDYVAVGKRIRGLRGEKRQIDWVKQLGCSQGYLSQVERGITKPSLEFLVTLSRLTGVDIDWILLGNQTAEVKPPQREEKARETRVTEERRVHYRRREDQILFWVKSFLQQPDALTTLNNIEQVLKLVGTLVFSREYQRLKSLLLDVRHEVVYSSNGGEKP
ncbi:MAG: XRE family transcriptional regulator [Nitrospinota bacterium]|nr:MAG: XRE family transcriptional regulator [Nitrospinota bacterium]